MVVLARHKYAEYPMAIRLRVTHLLVFAVLACCLTTPLIAQTDLGALQGHVQDQQSKALAGASVTLRNPSTAFDRTIPTDASGNYSFIGVPLTGSYVLTVNAPQFKPAEQKDINLRAGGTAASAFTLTVAAETTQTNVYGTTG